MSESNELKDALRVAVPVEPEEKVAARRAALLAVIEREIYATPQRVEKEQARFKWKRRARFLSIAAALIATLGLGMLVSEFEGQPPKLAAQSGSIGSAAEASRSPIGGSVRPSLAGQSFETAAGHEKVLQLAGDTRVNLAAHTRVFVSRDSESEQHLHLSSGGLLLSVAPDRKNRSVQVQTTHATVQVTGTIFGVEVGRFSQAADTPTRTRVSVERGQVVVLHADGKVVLEPGDTWLSPLQTRSSLHHLPTPREAGGAKHAEAARQLYPQEPAAAQAAGASEVGVARTHAASGVGSHAASGARPAAARALAPERAHAAPDAQQVEEPSSLAAQNNLLERALSAEERGNPEQARELIDRLLQRYPRSPLRASALAIRKRLDLD